MTPAQIIARSLREIANALEVMEPVRVEPAKPEPIGGFVSAEKLAEIVGLSVATIRSYNAYPDTPVIKAGRRCLYNVHEFQEWLRDGGPAKAKESFSKEIRRQHG